MATRREKPPAGDVLSSATKREAATQRGRATQRDALDRYCVALEEARRCLQSLRVGVVVDEIGSAVAIDLEALAIQLAAGRPGGDVGSTVDRHLAEIHRMTRWARIETARLVLAGCADAGESAHAVEIRLAMEGGLSSYAAVRAAGDHADSVYSADLPERETRAAQRSAKKSNGARTERLRALESQRRSWTTTKSPARARKLGDGLREEVVTTIDRERLPLKTAARTAKRRRKAPRSR